MSLETLSHTFPPVYDEKSRVLILGSFPSVLSRADGFYYGNPHNRFWPLLARLFGEAAPVSTEEKTGLLLRRQVALWDVIARCDISGSSDSSIKNVAVNDISRLLRAAPIERVFANGRKAYELYNRFCLPSTRMEATLLPSTSPANARSRMEDLEAAWRVILG